MSVDSENKRAVWGWAMYDWANSAFATTVMAGFFPIFFKQYWNIGVDVNLSTARLGFANSIASLLVALSAPIIGAIADKGSARKSFLICFAYLGALTTACLFVVHQGQWGLAALFYCCGIIGFSSANSLYDSLLPGLVGEDRVDFVSGLGFSLGYLGGGLLFLINVLMTLYPSVFGLADKAEAVRYAFLSVALWWGVFTLFLVFWVPDPRNEDGVPFSEAARRGITHLLGTLKKARRLKTIMVFLLAYWFYIDGVDTIIRMAVDYGLSLGFKDSDLITALLLVQFIGFPAALFFGKLGQVWGVKKSLFLAIGVYIAVALWGATISSPMEFYGLAVAIGLVQGGIQALSRSYYSRLIPKDQAAEFYGFYNMLGKSAAIIGPALIGIVGLAARRFLTTPGMTPGELADTQMLATRIGIVSIILLFLIGAALLALVDEEKGKAQAIELAGRTTP